jgi:hypothetical protein
MKINGFYLFLILFLLSIVAWALYPPLRYVKYSLPLLALLLYASRSSAFTDRAVTEYFVPFLFFYLFTIIYLLGLNLTEDNLSRRFFPNAAFILAPLTFVFLISPFFNKEYTRRYVLTIFFINAFVFLYEEGSDLISVLGNPQILKAAIFDSTVPTENHLAFAFGFLVIYFFVEKYNKVYQIIAIIIFILCYKRIVIAAVFLCVGSYILVSFLRIELSRYRQMVTLLGVLINLAFIKITHIIVSGTLDTFVMEKTGFSTDKFLMGRKTFYTWAFEEAGPITWTGTGLGRMDDTIFSAYGMVMNLHSEILKNYFEFGAILFVLWLILVFYKNVFSNKAAVFLLYLNILMLTDNVFTYFDVMFYFYFFILIFLHQKKLTHSQ